MEEKKRFDVIPVICLLLLGIFVGVIISKALQFGLKKYNEYWQNHNTAYGMDLSFFDVSAIDQDKEPSDSDLKDNALKLLLAHINNETAQSCGTDIVISDSFFEMIDPNYKVKEQLDSWRGLSEFLVLQQDNKAIVAFEYSIIPEDTEHAVEKCRGSYKPRPCSRMYLEMINGKWTVTDVLIIS